MATIFWAGDSTVQYNDILTFPQTGIGQVMNLFLKPGGAGWRTMPKTAEAQRALSMSRD